MCLEYYKFFKSFVSGRSQEIFISMSPIISEGTKGQKAPKRWPRTWVEIPRKSQLTQDYKDVWERLSSCAETSGLWKFLQILSTRL